MKLFLMVITLLILSEQGKWFILISLKYGISGEKIGQNYYFSILGLHLFSTK